MKLVDSSIRLFTQCGYNGPSIDRICEEASVSKMTFYRYFKDKNALIESVLSQKRTQFVEAVTDIEQSESGVRINCLPFFSTTKSGLIVRILMDACSAGPYLKLVIPITTLRV
ncbi:TetR/AcrR family transcriptional regulator [Vibrio salinus]|uniref:TetR/AcrR family transcriptional regulator n=1 Tax=Vibrio salinus TaxID=2899784 RepID=UPI00356679C6